MKNKYINMPSAMLLTALDHEWFYRALKPIYDELREQGPDGALADRDALINRIAKDTGVVITFDSTYTHVEITEPHEDPPLDMTGLIEPTNEARQWPFPKWPDERAKDALYPEVSIDEIMGAIAGKGGRSRTSPENVSDVLLALDDLKCRVLRK